METDDALWQRHIQINQYGCFLYGMKAVVPAMERSGGGSIVNISSVGAGAQGLARVLRLCRDQMGAAGGMTKSAAIDLGGLQNPSELGSSRSNRHRHDPRSARPSSARSG